MPTIQEVKKLRKDRVMVLNKIYVLSQGDVTRRIQVSKVHKPDFGGWSLDYVKSIIAYYADKGQITLVGNRDTFKIIRIAGYGIDQAEYDIIERQG
jgi:hypothetical protein